MPHTEPNPCLFPRIFLLSHMRAYTSLLGHILGSHPQINGYYEMHLSYEDASAVERQWTMYQASDDLKPGSRYLFDKLLHNDYALNYDDALPAGSRILISIRRPLASIRSIVDLFAKKEAGELYADPVEAARYYLERLEWLTAFACDNPGRYFYFDAEALIHRADALLLKLTQWLELDTPLEREYRLFSQTGQARKGDCSAKLRSGVIDGTETVYPEVAIPEDLMSEVNQVYEAASRVLLRHAIDSYQNN